MDRLVKGFYLATHLKAYPADGIHYSVRLALFTVHAGLVNFVLISKQLLNKFIS
jgi:hypothetical protein